MIRKVIKPSQRDFYIKIPVEYLNREIELIIFPLDDQEKNHNFSSTSQGKNKNIKSLKGIFSQYADRSKIALEDEAWQMNVINKFKKL